MTEVRVSPITDDDLPEVGRFLGSHFPPDTSANEWADVWKRTVNGPGSEAPNHGFLLRVDGTVAGAYPAIYSTRVIDGRQERFCNMAVWYVTPEHRTHSLRMVRAMLDQPGYHFTDLTPIEVVQRLNLRLGFRYLDTDTALCPNLPWPALPGRTRISADPSVIEASVAGPVQRYFRDHANCRWARHLLVTHRDRSCYVQWRVERRKNLPLFASIQYASDRDVLRSAFRFLASHFLLGNGVPFTLVETRVLGGRPRPSVMLSNHRRRMFKSAALRPEQIDYLYSELTAAP